MRQISNGKRPTVYKQGYDAQWKKTRAQFLKAYPICQDQSGCVKQATDVDHIDGEPLGPMRYDWSNLRALCRSHHAQRTARDQPGGWNQGTRATKPFVILVGESGSGKTTVRDQLTTMLGAVGLGPDDFDTGWKGLITVLDRSDRAVVECVRVPYQLQDRMKDRGCYMVELLVDEDIRRARLEAREDDQATVERFMKPLKSNLGYRVAIEPDLTLDGAEPARELADEIARRVRPLQIAAL